MSVSTQITRLSNAKDSLAAKMGAAGYTTTGKNLTQLVADLDLSGGGITVTEEQDAHGGTIIHITGGTISTQSKTVTPTTSAQTVTPDTGYSALSSVTVEAIPSQYVIPSGSINVSQNGSVDVSGKATAVVDVQPVLQSKTVVPTEQQIIVSADEYDYGIIAEIEDATLVHDVLYTYPNGATLEDGVEYNIVGDYEADPDNEFDDDIVLVNGAANYTGGHGEEFVFTTSGIIAQSDVSFFNVAISGLVRTNYDGLSQVTVRAVSSSYVGSGITRRSSSDLTASDATVSVPAGYYAQAASKSLPVFDGSVI